MPDYALIRLIGSPCMLTAGAGMHSTAVLLAANGLPVAVILSEDGLNCTPIHSVGLFLATFSVHSYKLSERFYKHCAAKSAIVSICVSDEQSITFCCHLDEPYTP